MSPSEGKARGVVIGLAAGDRNLGPTETALMIAESLIDRGTFDLADTTARWLQWWQSGAWDTGRVFDEVMALIDGGEDSSLAPRYVHEKIGGMTAGCNGAHRAPVLASSSGLQNVALDQAAADLTRVTHIHEVAVDAAVAVVRIYRLLICGATVEEAASVASQGLDPRIQASIEMSSIEPGGRDEFSPNTLQSALHFSRSGNSFRDALQEDVLYAGAPNYCPVLVGAICGDQFGADCIGDEMLIHCRDRTRLESTAHRLAHL